MVEVFSRTGLPSKILTDQGTLFMGKLLKHLCQLLDIRPIRMSPYHPQTDGLLERWHSYLLKKVADDKRDWDLYLLTDRPLTLHRVLSFSAN